MTPREEEAHRDDPKAPRTFLLVFVALIALAAGSFALSYVHLGVATVPVALAIAGAKAALVALFFMELVGQRFTNRIVLVVAVFFVALLVSLVAADVLTRVRPPMLPPH